jgi:hypothetical protein
MNKASDQAELFGLLWQPFKHPLRLHVNDIIRIDGKLCRIIRVSECAAVVVMNRPPREFKTRFDRPVRFQPSPVVFRISIHSEIEVLNRTGAKQTKGKKL